MYLIQSSRTSAPPRVISGRSLVHRKLGAPQKAAIAAGILNGDVAIKLSMRQLAQLVGVSVPYIRAASQLSSEVRRSIADDEGSLSFTCLLKSSFKPLALPKPVIVTDEKLSNIIKTAGIDRVLALACEVETAA